MALLSPLSASTSAASGGTASGGVHRGFSAEQRALLACLRAPLSAAESAAVRAACEEVLDWDEVLSGAARHRVLPLVMWNLQAVGWPGVPASGREALTRAFHVNASHTFALARELGKVGRLLEEAGLPMVSFKGPTLAQAAYGSVGLRQFGDLDVLVPRSDVLRARELLIADGFRSRVELAPAQEAAHLRDDSVFDLVRDQGLDGRPTSLELHWGVTARRFARPITFDHLRHRLRRGALAGGTATYLEAADLLVILCVHGTKHLWERLQWITDVSQLLRQAEAAPGAALGGSAGNEVGVLDWDRVRGLAVRFRVERMVALGLLLAHEVLGAPVPAQVLAWARGLSPVEALASQVQANLFAPLAAEGEDHSEAAIASSLFLVRAMDTWGDRAGFALHVATTPPAEERAALALPGPLERVRPLVRSARLLGAHLSHARRGRGRAG